MILGWWKVMELLVLSNVICFIGRIRLRVCEKGLYAYLGR